MIRIDTFLLGIKREFWEHRRTVIWVPAIFSVLVFMASAGVTISHRNSDQSEHTSAVQQVEPQQQNGEQEAKPVINIAELQQHTPIRFAAIYVGLAWLVSIFYLLSSFYSDRKDNSVLYWKSLPVSETQNALTKLIFGAVCFPAMALMIGWGVYMLLMLFGLGAMHGIDDGETWQFVERTFDVQRLMLMPLFGIVAGLLWGAPMFCYALMVSAMSKRFPFLMFLLPLIVLAALEGIFYRGSHLIGFFTDHFPFAVLETLSHSAGLGEFLKLQFIDNAGSLLGGWLLSAIFLSIAIWYRNHRFEV